MLTPRNLSKMAVGQCKYVLITNAEGGILNDPIALRIAEDKVWLSLADSDILLWAQGLAVHSGMDVSIREPDVSPLQLQGPNSMRIMQALFGEDIASHALFWASPSWSLTASRSSSHAHPAGPAELGYEALYPSRTGTRRRRAVGTGSWRRAPPTGLQPRPHLDHPAGMRGFRRGDLAPITPPLETRAQTTPRSSCVSRPDPVKSVEMDDRVSSGKAAGLAPHSAI